MDETLGRLAAKYGIEDFYISATGEYREISDETKLGLLDAMGVDTQNVWSYRDEESAASSANATAERLACYVPDWLARDRVWGVTTQLYAISSPRNQGIGDFEDLATLAELAAARGADFVGVNPLHALFWDDPDRCSPYFPSTRQFLNPLYIAVDALPLGAEVLKAEDGGLLGRLRSASIVDYRAVAALKHRVLREVFDRSSSRTDPAFLEFCRHGGNSLEGFARFETLSGLLNKRGTELGWLRWPEEFRDPTSESVARLLSAEEEIVLWHKWMQWIAHEQLQRAQTRALDAGMRIGLYLDIAVGVAPDGAATWADKELVTAKARIGCPPDAFNVLGQDWGLAPIVPSALIDRQMTPFEEVIEASMHYAGAVRIDHVMALEHLYWIPNGHDAREGGYVRYPREPMLDLLSRVSRANNTIVIGEDLGTVPAEFRDRMHERAIHSYRVFYFERDESGAFTRPRSYPENALACIGTHDLPTIRGWWKGHDIRTRLQLGLITQRDAETEELHRQQSREQLIALLVRDGANRAAFDANSEEPSDAAIIALHACIASGPSRLFAVQLDDLVGAIEQTNLPGTHLEYPNWRRKLPMQLSEIFKCPLVVRTLEAIAGARTARS